MGLRTALRVAIENLLYVSWYMLVIAGLLHLFTVARLSELREPLILGAIYGVITCPLVTAWLRPRLQRRFPKVFAVRPLAGAANQ